MPRSSHIVSDPRAFSAALYWGQFIVRYLLQAFFSCVIRSAHQFGRAALCNKAPFKFPCSSLFLCHVFLQLFKFNQLTFEIRFAAYFRLPRLREVEKLANALQNFLHDCVFRLRDKHHRLGRWLGTQISLCPYLNRK